MQTYMLFEKLPIQSKLFLKHDPIFLCLLLQHSVGLIRCNTRLDQKGVGVIAPEPREATPHTMSQISHYT